MPPSDELLQFGFYTRRPSPRPSVPVALGARSVVWRRFDPGEYEDNAVRPWVKLLWCVSGTGVVNIDGNAISLPPEHVALFLPGMRHVAWLPAESKESWELRWCTLDGSLCAEVIQALGLGRARVWHAGAVPTAAFEHLREAVTAGVTPEGERLADAVAYDFFARVANNAPLPLPDDRVDRAVDLIKENWSNADFGVEQLAQIVGLHRSALSRRFRARIGLPPSPYLTNLRMQHALSLLRATDLLVSEIARRSGFADADYFTRLFHRVQGVTPTSFRSDRG